MLLTVKENMFPEKLHEIYFKFFSNPEINQKILQKYPLNNQQHNICKRLNVSIHLWSFYLLKKESLCDSLILNREHFFFQKFMYLHDFSFLVYDYVPFRDMTLTEEEKFFIFYHEIISYHQQYSFCFHNTFPSLQNLCFHTLLKLKPKKQSFKSWLPFLPKYLLSQFQDEMELQQCRVPMPHYMPEQSRFKLYNASFTLKNLFSEIDTIPFSKEFVFWFQTEPTVRQQFQTDEPIKIVLFHFKRLRPYPKVAYKFCLRCMKRIWDQYAQKIGLERCYHAYDSSFKNQMKKLKSRRNWCAKCKRIPLFQVLSPEKYMKEYSNGANSKVEIFL